MKNFLLHDQTYYADSVVFEIVYKKQQTDLMLADTASDNLESLIKKFQKEVSSYLEKGPKKRIGLQIKINNTPRLFFETLADVKVSSEADLVDFTVSTMDDKITTISVDSFENDFASKVISFLETYDSNLAKVKLRKNSLKTLDF